MQLAVRKDGGEKCQRCCQKRDGNLAEKSHLCNQVYLAIDFIQVEALCSYDFFTILGNKRGLQVAAVGDYAVRRWWGGGQSGFVGERMLGESVRREVLGERDVRTDECQW